MIKKKSEVISIRCDKGTKEKLEHESEIKNVTLNTLVGQILEKHSSWDRFARELGFVFLTRPFLRALLDHVDEKTITTISVTTCRGAMRDSILFLKGEFTLQSFLEALDLWFEASNIPFRHIKKDDRDKFIVQHDLGRKWSVYLSSVISSLLHEIKAEISNQQLGAHSLVFEINRIKN